MQTIVFCPKCNGQNIDYKDVTPPEQPRMISMDDLSKKWPPVIAPFVMIRPLIRATCKDCGYFVEYRN